LSELDSCDAAELIAVALGCAGPRQDHSLGGAFGKHETAVAGEVFRCFEDHVVSGTCTAAARQHYDGN